MDSSVTSHALDRFLKFFAGSSISIYTFTGEQIQGSGKENLLDLILRRERYVCDTNSSWKDEVGKASNQSKAFIIPFTPLDEADDVHGNIFGKKVDATNENIFFFTAVPPQEPCALAIERYDSEFVRRFPDKLKQASQERIKKADPKYCEAECDRMVQVGVEREKILSLLKNDGVGDLKDMPPAPATEKVKADIIQYVCSEGPKCFKNYRHSMNIAGLCHAAILLERDAIGEKMRNEFTDPNRRNVFGDLLLLRDAFWFNACILTNDRAITRMAEYVALPLIKVVGMI